MLSMETLSELSAARPINTIANEIAQFNLMEEVHIFPHFWVNKQNGHPWLIWRKSPGPQFRNIRAFFSLCFDCRTRVHSVYLHVSRKCWPSSPITWYSHTTMFIADSNHNNRVLLASSERDWLRTNNHPLGPFHWVAWHFPDRDIFWSLLLFLVCS